MALRHATSRAQGCREAPFRHDHPCVPAPTGAPQGQPATRPPSWPAHRRPRDPPRQARRQLATLPPPVAASRWDRWPGHRNGWPGAIGIGGRVTGTGGRVPSERLAGSGRNGWPGAVGIRTRSTHGASGAYASAPPTGRRGASASCVSSIRSCLPRLVSRYTEDFPSLAGRERTPLPGLRRARPTPPAPWLPPHPRGVNAIPTQRVSTTDNVNLAITLSMFGSSRAERWRKRVTVSSRLPPRPSACPGDSSSRWSLVLRRRRLRARCGRRWWQRRRGRRGLRLCPR
jgi:hypothetical protein